MNLDLGTFQVDKVIAHDIPKRRADDQKSIVLSDVETPVNEDKKNLFSERIKRSLATTRYDAAFSSGTSSPVPKLIFDLLSKSGANEFVSLSQKIAKHLFASQNAVNPAGLLLIVLGTIEQKKVLAVLKLEKEEGVQIEHEEDADGRVKFTVSYLSSVILSQGTKVFKVGLFIKDGNAISSTKVYISDKQKGYQSKSEVATFFLEKFLGCHLIDSPEILTKKFFRTSQKFFNQKVKDPETQVKYELALITTINSNQSDIDPQQFAQDYLEGRDRQEFVKFLADNQAPDFKFEKDDGAKDKLANKMYVRFENGMSLVATPSTFSKDVTVEKISDERVKVTVEGNISQFGK